MGVLGVVAAGYVFTTGIASRSPTVLSDSATTGALIALIGSLLAVATLLLTASRASRIPGALTPISYAFSFEGVDVETSAGKSFTKWPAWKQAVETRSLFVLLSVSGVAHILPKRDLTPDEQMRLRILLNEILGGSRVAFAEHRS